MIHDQIKKDENNLKKPKPPGSARAGVFLFLFFQINMILACIREQIHLKEAGTLALFIFIVLIGIVATQFVDSTLGIRNLLARDVSTKAYVLHVLTWLLWGMLIGITGCRMEKKRNGLKY
jgi:hypothetical protein